MSLRSYYTSTFSMSLSSRPGARDEELGSRDDSFLKPSQKRLPPVLALHYLQYYLRIGVLVILLAELGAYFFSRITAVAVNYGCGRGARREWLKNGLSVCTWVEKWPAGNVSNKRRVLMAGGGVNGGKVKSWVWDRMGWDVMMSRNEKALMITERAG